MKKFALLLSLVGLASTLAACGDDGHKSDKKCDAAFADRCDDGSILHCDRGDSDKYGEIVELDSLDKNGIRYICNDNDEMIIDPSQNLCDDSYEASCKDGVYSYCKLNDGERNGVVVQKEEVIIDDIAYICNDKNDLIIKDYSCKNGVLSGADGNAVADNAACAGKDMIVTCNNDKAVAGHQACSDKGVLKCDNREIQVAPCDDGLKCLDYERDSRIYATCVKADNIQEGCAANVTAEGECQQDGSLIFCSRKDQSQGKTIRLDCIARNQACMLINQDYGYDCSSTCKEDKGNDKDANNTAYTEHGFCAEENGENILYYCHEGAVHTVNCTQNNKSCGFDIYQYNCI